MDVVAFGVHVVGKTARASGEVVDILGGEDTPVRVRREQDPIVCKRCGLLSFRPKVTPAERALENVEAIAMSGRAP